MYEETGYDFDGTPIKRAVFNLSDPDCFDNLEELFGDSDED